MIYSSWDIEKNILKLVILGHFLPFYSPKNPKNQNFEKWKKLLEVLSFYTYVPKITIIWCMVPEIWSETDRTFCYFGPFLFWTIGDIIILHKCTKNQNHILYCSLNMARNRCNCYFSFWVIFCPFTSLTTWKIKVKKKKKKKHGDIIILQ